MEPHYNEYKHHLDQITTIVKNSGARQEGNIFFIDGDGSLTELYCGFLPKRQNLAKLSTQVDAIVEIGFNAGHSALLMLTANPSLLYRGVDIGSHSYVKPCSEYLKSQFGNRFDLTIDSSITVMPNIFDIYPELEGKVIGWVIDGSHEIDFASEDLKNVVNLSKVVDTIVMDDTDYRPLRELVENYVANGQIDILLDVYDQMFCRVKNNIRV